MNDPTAHANEMVGAYVLDALSPGERTEFEAHLRTCADCRAEVAELRQVVDVLPLAVDLQEPPASLRDRIMAGARSERPPLTALAGGKPAGQSHPGRRPLLRSPGIWFGAVAALLIVALGAWNVQLHQRSQDRQSAFAHQVVLALSRGARVTGVAGTAAGRDASAAVVQPRGNADAYMIVSGLPPIPASKVYEIWLMRENIPYRAGVFTYSGSDAQIVRLPLPSTGFTATAVTDEPKPGLLRPTGRVYLVGKLTA